MFKKYFISIMAIFPLFASAGVQTFEYSCENGVKMTILADSGYMHFNIRRITINNSELKGIYESPDGDKYTWSDTVTGKLIQLDYDAYNPAANVIELTTPGMSPTKCNL